MGKGDKKTAKGSAARPATAMRAAQLHEEAVEREEGRATPKLRSAESRAARRKLSQAAVAALRNPAGGVSRFALRNCLTRRGALCDAATCAPHPACRFPPSQ